MARAYMLLYTLPSFPFVLFMCPCVHVSMLCAFALSFFFSRGSFVPVSGSHHLEHLDSQHSFGDAVPGIRT